MVPKFPISYVFLAFTIWVIYCFFFFVFIENELVIDTSQKHVEISGLVEAISTTSSTSDAKQEIEERKRKFLQLIQDEISKVSTSEEMDAVEKMYAPMKPTLAAVRSQQQFAKKFVGESSKTPSNKKIEPQRRLFSTKKRKTQKASLAKPTAEEADMLAVQLLME